MITRLLSKGLQSKLTTSLSYKFGGPVNTNYSVTIDKQTPWIKYIGDPKCIWLNGVQQPNYGLQPLDDSNPFEHLDDASFFSFNNWWFNDPWYHDDSHEPYFSGPERGYINGSDPIESRFFYGGTIFASIAVVSILMSFVIMSDNLYENECVLYRHRIARDYVFSQLENKNKELNQLRAKEQELLAKND